MMKIGILITTLGSGGAERQAVNLARMLKRNSHDVSIVTFFGDNFYVKDLDQCGISVVNLHAPKRTKAILAVRKQIRHEQYDAVIAFLCSPILCACAASLVGKKWKLITRLGSANESFFTSSRGKAMNKLAKVADSIVCNSHLEREMWRKYSSLPDSKFKVIYNLYPDLTLRSAQEKIPDRRERIKIVVPASYSWIKNVQNVVTAAKMLNTDERSRLEIHWYGHREIAAGDTKQHDRAVELVKQFALEDTVFLHDETWEIYDKMLDADFVGLFSLFEGLPNAICEAMLLSIPVVMTEVSDYQALVNGNGFTCSQSAEGIHDVLKKVIATSELERKAMGQRSGEIAKKLFSFEVTQREWLETLSIQGER